MEEEKPVSEIKEVTKELVGWEDNKLWRTLKGLTLSPGATIRGFCGEDGQKYLSPITYFLGVTAVEAYVASYFGLFEAMLDKNKEELKRAATEPSLTRFFDTQQVSERVFDYLNFVTSETGQKVIFVPFVLLFTWLFYKKFNKSFKQNSWYALYTLGHATLLAIPLIPIWYFSKDLVLYSNTGLAIIFIYSLWSSKQFYNLSLGKALVYQLLLDLTLLIALNVLSFIVMTIAFASYLK